MAGQFGTELIHLDGEALIAVRGEIDSAASIELDAACRSLELLTDRLVLDFTAVTFLDSSGLGVLVELSRGDRFADVTIRNAPDRIKRIFEITELHRLFLEPVDDLERDVADR